MRIDNQVEKLVYQAERAAMKIKRKTQQKQSLAGLRTIKSVFC
jgi:hypothetical protein